MLLFDEATHTYTKDGIVIPSVTQILTGVFGNPKWATDYSAERGTAVHKACEIFNKGQQFAAALDPVILPYFEAWKKFLVEKNVKITHAEQLLDHPRLRYAGKFDARGTIGREKWLFDIKTTAVLSPMVGVQLAAYENMTGEILNRGAVQLKPDGTYVFQEYPSRADWPTFVACLTVFNFKQRLA